MPQTTLLLSCFLAAPLSATPTLVSSSTPWPSHAINLPVYGIPAWLSEDLRGRVVLLNFWVFTCGNGTRTVPSLVHLDRRYRSRGSC